MVESFFWNLLKHSNPFLVILTVPSEETQFLVSISKLENLEQYRNSFSSWYEIEENGVLYIEDLGFIWFSNNNHIVSFMSTNKNLELFNSFFEKVEPNFSVDREKQRNNLDIIGNEIFNSYFLTNLPVWVKLK